MFCNSIFFFLLTQFSLSVTVNTDVWQQWINHAQNSSISEDDLRTITDLEQEFNSLPNSTSDIHPNPWEHAFEQYDDPSIDEITPVDPSLDTHSGNDSYFHRPPTEVTGSCTKLFQAYKQIKYELECLVDNIYLREVGTPYQKESADVKDPNIEPPVDPRADDTPRLIYLREFLVSSSKTQQLYCDPRKATLTLGFRRLRLLTLRNFISWLKVQGKLLRMLMPLNKLLKTVFSVRYRDLKTQTAPESTTSAPTPTTVDFGVVTVDEGLRYQNHRRRHNHHHRNRHNATPNTWG